MTTDDAYAYCAGLTRGQWAWEFLRRNPQYQTDYQQFIATWRTLEADYGAPPNRDFTRWKQDPRAYGPLAHTPDDSLAPHSADLCIGENDRVFIECWMGAKWGFHKFPLDPERTSPPNPDELSWRPPPTAEPRPTNDAMRLDIPFNLSLPLPPQLEAAKFRLVSRAAELRRSGQSVPMTVANQRTRWTQMIRLLDAETTGENHKMENDEALLKEAIAMVQGDYLHILRLGDN